MQDFNTPKSCGDASLSRRAFLSIAAAGATAILPALALAEAAGKTSRLHQAQGALPLEQQLNELTEKIKEILRLMHPEFRDVYGQYVLDRCTGAPAVYLWGARPACLKGGAA